MLFQSHAQHAVPSGGLSDSVSSNRKRVLNTALDRFGLIFDSFEYRTRLHRVFVSRAVRVLWDTYGRRWLTRDEFRSNYLIRQTGSVMWCDITTRRSIALFRTRIPYERAIGVTIRCSSFPAVISAVLGLDRSRPVFCFECLKKKNDSILQRIGYSNAIGAFLYVIRVHRYCIWHRALHSPQRSEQ